MDKKTFYDKFHKKSSVQFKIITKNNYTYSPTLKLISKLVPEGSKFAILDYGCGVGAVDFYLANLGHQVLGTDISPDAISMASQTAKNFQLENNVKFITLDKFNSYKKNTFDLILCNEVLEHLKNDAQVLVSFTSLLKKNGKLVVSVPSLNAPLYKIGLTNGFDKEVGHLRRYSDQTITELLKNSGYQVDQVIKREGIVRNSFYVIKPLGIFIKFIKGPFVQIISFVDNVSRVIWGESDIAVVASIK